MPKINVCFVWHMHQPFYKDLATGEYKLPWTRLHALKDYYGMVKISEDYPEVHQTFNLVPSLLVQIDEYASGKASDPFMQLALKPAEELNARDKQSLLKFSFQANEERVIKRYPRYAELFRVMEQNEHNPQRASGAFSAVMMRDLQVLSQLAWFDEEYQSKDAKVRGLIQKGRNYSWDDQKLMGEKQAEFLKNVLPAYREAARRGQVELSTSPFYHPILPLLCDSDIASASHPYVPLPARFSYPQDAEEQLACARSYFEKTFGFAAAGLWPSEGSVSDQTLGLAARTGFQWVASDDGVLSRTLGTAAQPLDTYRPYEWRDERDSLRVVFRDHHLSNLIGFVYQQIEPAQAATHFLSEVRKNCQPVLQEGRDALVPIVLDGENAWEHYAQNGRPFLRELYSQMTADRDFAALTVSEALASGEAQPLTHIFPGSWMDSNFDIWIGAEEDNCAWDHLLQARQTYDRVAGSQFVGITEEAKRLAHEELLIAEGSDWCWWYGPEHSSANKAAFDQLYRGHLTNVYRLLGEPVPRELGNAIARGKYEAPHEAPNGLIQPVIDGRQSSHGEWTNAGRHRVDHQSGAMHSHRSLIQNVLYGSDGSNLFLRLDLADSTAGVPLDFRFCLRNGNGETIEVNVAATGSNLTIEHPALTDNSVEAALDELFEMRVSMEALHMRRGDALFLRLVILRDGLPAAALPMGGEVELRSMPMVAYAF